MNYTKLFLAIALCQSAGILGSFFTGSAIQEWYVYLDKPWFSPPNWLFAPVWITLYTLMGISLYRIWRSKKNTQHARHIFYVHLVLNAYWSIVFFGLRDIASALGVIVMLFTLILILIGMFYKIDKKAAYLLVPYALWVGFASMLNYAIVSLNAHA